MVLKIWTAVAVVVATLGTADAGQLATGLLYTGSATANLFCIATPVGEAKTTNVTVMLIPTDGSGAVVHTCPLLGPGGDALCQVGGTKDSTCVVTFSGSSKNIRANITMTSIGNNIVAVEPAR